MGAALEKDRVSTSCTCSDRLANAVSQWGLPNGYILGEEASGAFIGGLRYGDGTIYTKNAGDARVFWQGPSLGFDAGADGARTMMLIYNLPRTAAIFDRFGGVAGSAYFGHVCQRAPRRRRRTGQNGFQVGSVVNLR
jgi:hypothetical protein